MRSEGTFLEESPSVHSENTMRMMLDGNSVLREVEIFLRGYYMTTDYDDTTKETTTIKVSVGEPKANEKGVQSIMFWLKTKITPLVSLGNIKEDQYNDYLFRSRVNLGANLMSNRINYGISLADYTEVIDIIMESFEAFFTSAISGGHRKAVFTNHKVEHKELVEQNKGIMGGIFR